MKYFKAYFHHSRRQTAMLSYSLLVVTSNIRGAKHFSDSGITNRRQWTAATVSPEWWKPHLIITCLWNNRNTCAGKVASIIVLYKTKKELMLFLVIFRNDRMLVKFALMWWKKKWSVQVLCWIKSVLFILTKSENYRACLKTNKQPVLTTQASFVKPKKEWSMFLNSMVKDMYSVFTK